MRIADRDKEILDTLARKVRALTVEQAAAAWWPDVADGPRQAFKRLKALATAGFLRTQLVHVAPPLLLVDPLCSWTPELCEPDFRVLARKLQTRWPDETPRATEVVLAGTKTNSLFGGPFTRPRFTTHHATHDLHVAEVYLLLRRTRPALAAAWQGEDIRPKSGFRLKDPDAIVPRPSLGRDLVIEFGGRSYTADHLATFHRDCVARDRDYELW